MKSLQLSFLLAFSLFAEFGFGHALLTSPTPRNNNAGLKSGPCGGVARTAAPTQLTGGQTLTITWRETIDHPGRYIFSLSAANDMNFNQYPLKTVLDTQDSGGTPHNYSTTVQIPNINCDACTLQMIQSMEENPASPSYYYSCADVRITATTATPSPGTPVTSQQSNAAGKNTPQMASCGTIKDLSPPPPPMKLAVYMLLLLLPFLIGLKLRMAPARKRKSK